jgi:hypothetical protein
MKVRKENTGWQNDTEKLKRRDQVVISRLRTGYSKDTHRSKMGGEPQTQPARFAAQNSHWNTLETEEERRKSDMAKEVWEKGEERAKMLVEYVKNIGLYYGL